MHITKLELKNFKRFTDLTLDLSALPQPPKLVLLIGANGSGKSSVFDAFEALSVAVRDKTYDFFDDTRYYGKKSSEGFYARCEFDDGLVVSLHNAHFLGTQEASFRRIRCFMDAQHYVRFLTSAKQVPVQSWISRATQTAPGDLPKKTEDS